MSSFRSHVTMYFTGTCNISKLPAKLLISISNRSLPALCLEVPPPDEPAGGVTTEHLSVQTVEFSDGRENVDCVNAKIKRW